MDAVPQFGAPLEGRRHRDRPAAFGLLGESGKLALVRVTPDDGGDPWLDLPGGALDPGEGPEEAVVREFAEETGLKIAVGEVVGEASQYFTLRDDEAVNNRCVFFAAQRLGGEAEKIEDDHELVWVDISEALASLRHDAHAWGVCAWLRSSLAKA